jgi:hypothetical protein
MDAIIYLNNWSSHHNMFLYSAFYYFSNKQMKFIIRTDNTLPSCGIVMRYNNDKYFFDYSDSPEFIANPQQYKLYFKRSLLTRYYGHSSLIPLGFQLNYSYKPIRIVFKFKLNDLLMIWEYLLTLIITQWKLKLFPEE